MYLGKRSIQTLTLFSGSSQLWKLDGKILKNANLWAPYDELEVEFKTEYILIRNISNIKVLTVINEADLVEQNFEEGKDEQLWTQGEINTDGFFTLKNLKVQKYLTAVSESILQVRGKYPMHNGEDNVRKFVRGGQCPKFVRGDNVQKMDRGG